MTPQWLLDTSAAVPLILVGHEAHERTFDALNGSELGLAGTCLVRDLLRADATPVACPPSASPTGWPI